MNFAVDFFVHHEVPFPLARPMLDHLQGGVGDDQQAAFLTIHDKLGDTGDRGIRRP